MLLSDIAKQAFVSPSTVSRAINQPDIVAAESLARIRAVMESHAYVPAPANRRRGPKSRQARLRRLGVWFVGAKADNPSLNWFQERIADAQTENPRLQIEVHMLFSNSPEELPRALTQERLDGVIIQGMEPPAAVLRSLKNLPCVWFMTRRSDQFPGDFIEPNNEENGQLAANYLADRGHRTVAVLTTEPGYSANSRRIRAFADHAARRGLTCHQILGEAISHVSYLEIAPINQEIAQLVQRLSVQSPRPTGLYLPSDHFSGALFRTLRLNGFHFSRQFEVILGNYNPLIYNNLELRPAAIDINLSTLVRKVIDHLVWRIENPDTPGRIGLTVSPTLRLPHDHA
jgi:LacI family transcriptional regulator